MRAHLVVVPSPALDHDLGLAQAVEDLAIEQLVAEPGVEALDEAVLPGAAWDDVGGLGTHRRDPCLDRLGDELGAVVGADVARHAAQDEQIGQALSGISCVSGHDGSEGAPTCRDAKSSRSPTPSSTSFWPGPIRRRRSIRTASSTA